MNLQEVISSNFTNLVAEIPVKAVSIENCGESKEVSLLLEEGSENSTQMTFTLPEDSDILRNIEFFDADEEVEFKERIEVSKEMVDKLRKAIKEGKVGFVRTQEVPFNEECYRLTELHEKKNKDYGNTFSDMFSRYGMTYAIGHLREKLERIETVSKNGNMMESEGINDSLRDLASYAIMTLVEINRGKEAGNE